MLRIETISSQASMSRSQTIKNLWQNPEYRRRQNESRGQQWREQIRASVKANAGKYAGTWKKSHIPWNKGQKLDSYSDEHRDRISNALTGRTLSRKHKKAISRGCKGNRKIIDAATQNWKDDEYVRKQMIARNVKQNKTEKLLESILETTLPGEYAFVGSGSFILGGKNPDFVNVNNKRKIIELFGSYWHDESEEAERVRHFCKYKYDTLIVWDYELRNKEALINKLVTFHSA